MDRKIKYILGLLLLTSTALAGLPPTTSKGSGDVNNVVTFNYLFPNNAITHTGITASVGLLGVAGGGTGTGTAFTQGSVLFAGALGVYSQDNSEFFWDDTNHRLGIGTAVPSAMLSLSGSITGTPSATGGSQFFEAGSTFTDSNTAASGTAAGMNFNTIGINTLAATNTTVTTTQSNNLYIRGAPKAGTNETIVSSAGLFVDSSSVTPGVTNSYGLEVNAMTGGLNNYAGIFNGGNVGVGTSSPSYALTAQFASGGTTGTATPNGLLLSDTANGATWDLVNPYSDIEFDSADVSGVGAGGRFRIGTVMQTAGGTLTRLGLFSVPTTAGTYNEAMTITAAGNVGVGTTSPTASLHLKAGTATAGTAPLKIASGTNLTTAESGAMEFDGTNLYYTTSTPTRLTIAATTSPYVKGDVLAASSTTALSRLAVGSNGQFLVADSTQTTGLKYATGSYTPIAPTVERFTSGSGTYNLMHAFYVTSANATVGATYTNNSVTYTVYSTISAGTLLYASGNGNPLASGTLTKATGTGDATITFSAFQNPIYLMITAVGGGGGGNAAASNTTGTSAGGNTTFGSSLLTANGGAAGGGAGGTATVSAPATGVIALPGDKGSASTQIVQSTGGNGGANALGGAGAGGVGGTGAGSAGVTNSGAGGGGGGGGVGTTSGEGGSAGGYLIAEVPSPSQTYSYGVGAAGTGSSATNNGGAGGSGIVVVQEFFQ